MVCVGWVEERGDSSERFEMRRTTTMEISQFTQARIQLSDVVCIYIYHGCRAIKSASGRAENYPPACGRTNAGTDPTTYALGKFWHANNYVGLHRYTSHGTTSGLSRVCAAAHASEQTLPVNISGMASNTRGASSSKRQKSDVHTLRFSTREEILNTPNEVYFS